MRHNSKAILLIFLLLAVGCSDIGQLEEKLKIVDVDQTDVERQSIGNCWIYAQASWVESMHLRATGEEFDVSQSYWTYMHWFGQITSGDVRDNEISTGGTFSRANGIIRDYGLIGEADFIQQDTISEMSYRQSTALSAVNRALAAGGELETGEARRDPVVVRRVLDEAWGLSAETVDMLDSVFGEDLQTTLRGSADESGTPIINPDDFLVSYTYRPGDSPQVKTLSEAMYEWRYLGYSSYNRRRNLQRVQRALHQREPVLISWFVDFNALEYGDNDLYGSFNLTTLENASSPGRQGGHMTVLEDYEAIITVPETIFEESGNVDGGDWVHYEPIVLEDDTTITIQMTGNNDADVYVRMGAQPNARDYDCRPYTPGSNETCTASGPGELFVSVNGYRDGSEFTIQVSSGGSQQVLEADVTLDPSDPEDSALLQAALADDTEIVFFRIKNSWGADREGLPFAPGPHTDDEGEFERGYHDLYMDYLNGPIVNVEDCDNPDNPTWDTCPRNETPLNAFYVPAGYLQ